MVPTQQKRESPCGKAEMPFSGEPIKLISSCWSRFETAALSMLCTASPDVPFPGLRVTDPVPAVFMEPDPSWSTGCELPRKGVWLSRSVRRANPRPCDLRKGFYQS